MAVRTGQTVYQDIMSLDADNNPVSGATFDIATTLDGTTYTGLTVTVYLADDVRAIFSASWSAGTTGDYQLYAKNNITNVIFISDIVTVAPDSVFEQNIFIGL